LQTMKKLTCIACSIIISFTLFAQQSSGIFPDGSPIPAWFDHTEKLQMANLGKSYIISDYGAVLDSNKVQTDIIQKTIDKAAMSGGGVIVIPRGTFLSGALFFRPKTHLHVVEGGKLKGSDNIADYPMMPSRMEGQNLDYFPALVNAYGVDGFTMSGKGIIDGNGKKYWEAFWQRRKENPKCTNLEVSRPRLVFIWNSNNVQVEDLTLQNSGFWSSHYYQCVNVKILNLRITSPYEPIKAPSTDAIDLDVCTNVLIKGCYMSVNDDAIAIKGGKGPWADMIPSNGANQNIIIEDCEFGFCHAAVTCGSEAIHNKNIIIRNCKVDEAKRLLWLKMRPDTPQLYEYILVDNIKGNAYSVIYAKPWTQFFDLKGRKDVPVSSSNHVTMKNIDMTCNVFFDVQPGEHDHLSNFVFENIRVKAEKVNYKAGLVKDITFKNVVVNNEQLKP